MMTYSDPPCNALRQGDEMFCPTCDLRWDVADPIVCPLTKPEPTDRDRLRLRLAKAILGPHRDNHIGHEMMLKLRDHKWGMATKGERQERLNEAEAVMKEIGHEH